MDQVAPERARRNGIALRVEAGCVCSELRAVTGHPSARPNDKGLFLKDIVVDRKDKEGYNCTQRVLNKVEGTLAKEKARKNTLLIPPILFYY